MKSWTEDEINNLIKENEKLKEINKYYMMSKTELINEIKFLNELILHMNLQLNDLYSEKEYISKKIQIILK